jgi:hypothetical protein
MDGPAKPNEAKDEKSLVFLAFGVSLSARPRSLGSHSALFFYNK